MYVKPEVNDGCLPQTLFTYILGQDLSVNLEFMESTSLAV